MPDANGEITFAEQCAEREGTPTVAITNFELARILAGNPMMCQTLDGREILVRLPTADEVLASVERASDRLAADLPRGPGMTREQAVMLTAPIDTGRF